MEKIVATGFVAASALFLGTRPLEQATIERENRIHLSVLETEQKLFYNSSKEPEKREIKIESNKPAYLYVTYREGKNDSSAEVYVNDRLVKECPIAQIRGQEHGLFLRLEPRSYKLGPGVNKISFLKKDKKGNITSSAYGRVIVD